MKKHVLWIIACLCLTGLSGCYTADSGNYATEEIICDFTVDLSGTTAKATASFWIVREVPASLVYLVLTDGDKVLMNGVEMTRQRGPVSDYYTVTVEPAEAYVFTFERGDGTSYEITGAPILPLTITSPAEGDWVSRNQDMNISWTNPVENGNVTLFVPNGEYTTGFLEDVADTGAYTIPAGTFLIDETAPSQSYETSVSITRKVREGLAPELNGAITVKTSDMVPFVITD